MPEPSEGLEPRKYRVERRRPDHEKHPDCRYFVLDLDHDVHARRALLTYAESCEDGFPALAKDLYALLAFLAIHEDGQTFGNATHRLIEEAFRQGYRKGYEDRKHERDYNPGEHL